MANADKEKVTKSSDHNADVSPADAASSSREAGADTDEGIVIVDVETLLAEKIPELKKNAKKSADTDEGLEADSGDETHSAFADALEDALGNSFDDEPSGTDDDIDALDDLLKETELDDASAILEVSEDSRSDGQTSSTTDPIGAAMGQAVSADDDPSVVFGVFPSSYSNMPGADAVITNPAQAVSNSSHSSDTEGDNWEHRALIAAAGAGESEPQAKSNGSLLKAGALGMLGGLAIVGGVGIYAMKNDMIELGGIGDRAVVKPAVTAATTQTAAVDPAPTSTHGPASRPAPHPVQVQQPASPPTPAIVEEPIPATAGVDVANARGLARNPIALSITPRDMGNRNNYYIRIAGIPPGAKLSAGLNIGGGMWLLRPSSLADVTLKVPSYFSGDFEMYAQLLQEDGKTPINQATPFTVKVEAEPIAATASQEPTIERRANVVVNEIAKAISKADRPKLAQVKPATNDLAVSGEAIPAAASGEPEQQAREQQARVREPAVTEPVAASSAAATKAPSPAKPVQPVQPAKTAEKTTADAATAKVAAVAPVANKKVTSAPSSSDRPAVRTAAARKTREPAAGENDNQQENVRVANLDKLAALPEAEETEELEVEEEGLGYLPEDLSVNPTGLEDSGIRPPARAARAPRRSLLSAAGNPLINPSQNQAGMRTAHVATGAQPPRPAAPSIGQSSLRGGSALGGGNPTAPVGSSATIRAAATRSAMTAPAVRPVGNAVRPVVQANPAISVASANTATTATANEAEQLRLIRKGDRFYKLGDLASARLFYLRAYHAGSAMAAMAVGRTYDPVYFEKLGVRGFQPDPQKALEWYNKALSSGFSLARTKVADLNRWLGR